MWEYYQPNPCGKAVGDCSVRAISAALNISWEKAYVLLCCNGFMVCDLPNADSVWGAVLREHGFVKELCPDCYTAGRFAEEHPEGTFVLGYGGHVATVKSGKLMDSWDSSNELITYFWRDDNASV